MEELYSKLSESLKKVLEIVEIDDQLKIELRVKKNELLSGDLGSPTEVKEMITIIGGVSQEIILDVDIDENILKIAEMVRPKLVQDGMFLVGLDIVGDKLIEINVLSPGGLIIAQQHYGVNFSQVVIRALERKVQYMQFYKRKFNNAEMATL